MKKPKSKISKRDMKYRIWAELENYLAADSDMYECVVVDGEGNPIKKDKATDDMFREVLAEVKIIVEEKCMRFCS